MNKKTCPLISIAAAAAGGNAPVPCQGGSCAWYVSPNRPGGEGRCAIQFLGALPELVQAVKGL